jgi:hypothetical protein
VELTRRELLDANGGVILAPSVVDGEVDEDPDLFN